MIFDRSADFIPGEEDTDLTLTGLFTGGRRYEATGIRQILTCKDTDCFSIAVDAFDQQCKKQMLDSSLKTRV